MVRIGQGFPSPEESIFVVCKFQKALASPTISNHLKGYWELLSVCHTFSIRLKNSFPWMEIATHLKQKGGYASSKWWHLVAKFATNEGGATCWRSALNKYVARWLCKKASVAKNQMQQTPSSEYFYILKWFLISNFTNFPFFNPSSWRKSRFLRKFWFWQFQ